MGLLATLDRVLDREKPFDRVILATMGAAGTGFGIGSLTSIWTLAASKQVTPAQVKLVAFPKVGGSMALTTAMAFTFQAVTEAAGELMGEPNSVKANGIGGGCAGGVVAFARTGSIPGTFATALFAAMGTAAIVLNGNSLTEPGWMKRRDSD